MPEVGEVKYVVALDGSNVDSDAQSTGSQIQASLDAITGKLDKSFGYQVFKDIGKAFVEMGKMAVDAVKSVGQAIGDTAEYGDNIDKMSQKLGMSAQAYQEWDAVLQHSGTNIESMQTSMKTLAAAAETDSKAFEQLGLSQEAIANMSQEELFGATITALQNVDSETERTYLAGKLLGRGATELGALLNTSAEDTEAMRKRVHELGGVMSDEAVKASAAYQDSLQDMTTAIDGAKRGLIEGFMPAMTTVMDGLTEIFAGNTEGGMQLVTDGINAMVEQITSIAGQIGAFFDENMDEIIEIGTSIFSLIVQGIADALPILIDVISGILGNVVSMIVEHGPDILAAVLAILTKILTNVGSSLPQIVTNVVGMLGEVVRVLMAALPDLLKAGIQIIASLVLGILQEAPNLIMEIGNMLVDMLNTFAQSGPDMMQRGMDMIQKVITGIVNNLPAIISAIVQVLAQLIATIAANAPQFLQKGIELLVQLATGIVRAIPQLIGQLPQIFNSAMRALGSYPWGTLGWNIIVGIANGISSGAYSVWNALVGAVQRAWSSVLSWLGIRSPSRRARDEIGKRIPQGAAEGIEEESDLVTDAMVDTYKTAFDVAERFTGDISYNMPDLGGYAADVGAQLGYSSEQTVIVPVTLDGREIARVTAPFMGEQLAWES